MRELSELLRSRREELGIALQQAQTDTKIRLKYLQALEAGDEAAFPGEVYLKGFLRTYGDYLGLDGWELVRKYRAYRESVSGMGERERKPERIGGPPAPIRLGGRSRIWSAVFVMVLLGALGVLVGGRTLFGVPESRPPVPPPGAEEPEPPAEPHLEPERTQEDEERQADERPIISLMLDRADEAIFEVIADELVVELIADEACWIRVTVDGGSVPDETLLPGNRRLWRAREEIWFRAGNPDGVRLVINGVDMGPAGSHRRPRNVLVKLKPRG